MTFYLNRKDAKYAKKNRREDKGEEKEKPQSTEISAKRAAGRFCSQHVSSWLRSFVPSVTSLLSLCVLCVFAVPLLLLSFPAQAELRAGAAKVDMTPDVKARPIPLGGYAARLGRPATGVHDPVYARALVLSDGNIRIGIVSLDLCFLPANVKTEVFQKLKADGTGGLDEAHLFLSATHTHSAPDPLAMHSGNTFKLKGWTPFDSALLAFTAEKIAQALRDASKQMVPVQIGVGTVDATGANRNRRGDPIVDPAFTTIKVTATGSGRTLAAIVDFAAHPTLYDDKMMDVSADWPGVMTADLEKSEAAGAGVCLFLNGAEGDASPNGVDEVKPDDKVAAYGHRMGTRALASLAAITPHVDTILGMWTQPVALPPRKPTGSFIVAAMSMGATLPQANALVDALMPTSTQISFIRLGDLLLLGFPCEPSGEIGLAAKQMARDAGYKLPAIVALTNDWLAYALTPAQYKAGKYEAVMSFYGDQFGPTLLEGIKTGLKAGKQF